MRTNPKPHIVFPPGTIIQEELESRNMTTGQFAEAMGLPEWAIEHLISGALNLDKTAAERLESIFGISATFWLNMESRFRERINQLLKP